MAVEVVAEGQHALVAAGAQLGHIGNHVIADEVDAHMLVGQNLAQRLGMLDVVVEPLPHDVLDREAALVGEVILAQHLEHLVDGIDLLERHERLALVVHSVVHTDSDVHTGLLDQRLEFGLLAHGADGDALGAPCQTPRLGEDGDDAHHLVEIVEGFAHAHKHDIGQLLALWDAEHLVDDLVAGEVAMESLAPGHAEVAVHAAALLRRDAQRVPVLVGDIDGLDGLTVAHVEEVLDGAVLALLGLRGEVEPHAVALGQPLAVGLADVEHLAEGGDTLVVDPPTQLLGGEQGHAQFLDHLVHILKGHSRQWDELVVFFHIVILIKNLELRIQRQISHRIKNLVSSFQFLVVSSCLAAIVSH